MRKNYPNLSINQLDKSIALDTLIKGMFRRILFFLIFYAYSTTTISAQCNTETPLPFIDNTFGNLTATGSLGGVCLLCSASNASRLIDADLNNFATAAVTIGVAGSVNYRVTDSDTDYISGTYAGYRIDTRGLLNVNLLGSITIRTYLNGGLRETATGSSLLGVGLLNGSGNNYVVGFNTTKSFDAIEISIGSLVGLLNTVDVYYPVIRNYCAGPALSCNTVSPMNLPTYPVSLEPSHTGISGVTVGNIYDAKNVISSSTADYATIALNVGVVSSGSISVKDQLTDYPVGTYAGFEIENSNLLSVSALANIYITTYLNGAPQDQFSGNNLVVNGSLLNTSGRHKVGFVSTKSFDEVQISIRQTIGLNLGSTKVYGAVFENFCTGPNLVCNTQTGMVSPTYPVYINGVNTGIDGVACVACSVNNADNLIDQNTSNYAQINLTVGAVASGSISVKDQITDYPIGSFVGFTLENPSLLNVNALDAITITTYLNGSPQEIKFGNSALATVGSNLLVGSSLYTIGFITTKAFDEARITIANTVAVNLGVVNVYNAVFQKLCPVTLECNKTYALTNPTFPVIIDSGKTGVDGVACVACAVNNTNNVLTASTTDFATVLVTAGVIAPASIAVLDQLSTYPVGTFAGFTIKDLNSLIQLDLFSSLTISTYLDGVLRDSKSASQLLNLSLLTPFGSGSGIYNVGFQASKTFDEIRISVGSLASVINDINVYGAFVNTASTSGGTLFCAVIDAVNDSFSPTIGSVGNSNIGNVLTNDTLNGNPVAISDINFAVITPAVPMIVGASVPFINPVTGVVSIPAGTPAGNYTITYQICYKLNSLTCDSATVTVNVTAAVIDAVDDINTGTIYGTTGGNTGINVYANDTLNGNPVNPSDVVLTSLLNGPLTVNTDGSVIVASNTPGGIYTIDYTICEKLNPTNCSTATVTVFVSSPSIALVKTGAVGGTGTIGDMITYTFTVTNTGNTTLTNIFINDALTGSTNLAVTPSSLTPNTVGTVTATYTIQLTDVNAGQVTNSATVTGTTPTGGTVSDTSGTTITNNTPTVTPLTPNPSIAVVKTGAVGGTGTVGDMVTYTFTVTNTGNTTLSNIVINDLLTGSTNLAVTPSTLAPNGVGTATATYTIQLIDMNAGQVTNSATVTGTTPTGGTVSDTSGTTITNDTSTVTPLTPNPSIAVVKTGVIGGTGEVGYMITYTFTVTNTGNTTLSNIVINDALTNSVNLAVTPSTLVPNAIGTATASYTIQQSDIDLGKVTNSATVSGTTPAGGTVTDTSGTTITDNTPTVTTLNPSSSIALVKVGAVGGVVAVGNVITYSFTVTNTGNTTLSNIVINDLLTASVNLAVTPSTLAPNGIGTATATYTIQQSDIDLGKVTNSATVTGTTPTGGTVTDTSGTTITNNIPTETTLNPNSSIALVKVGVVGGTVAVGDVITYGFTVTNTGNTTLSNIVINDLLTGSTNLAVTPSTLAPNGIGTVTATYTVKQSDIDLGTVNNSATVTGTTPAGGTVSDTSGTTITNDTPTVTPLTPSPSIAIVKTGAVGGTGMAGDMVTYTFTVTNTGNTTLSNIVINDVLTASVNLAVTPSTLAPNAIGTATATYTIQQSDVNVGQVTNSATVTGTTPAGGTVSDTSGTTITNDTPTVTPLTPSPSIAIVKTGAVGGTGMAGDMVTYTFTVTNTGNTTLSNIVINDLLTASVNLAVTPSTLAPNAIGTATATYTIQQSDVNVGQVTNSATVTGTTPAGGTVSDTSGTTITNDTPTVTPLTPSPSIAVVKTGAVGGTGMAGDMVTYTFTVTNTGNTTLSNIVVNDALTNSVNLAVTPSTLAPNAIGTATATYVIQQSDVNAGQVTNSATVTGTTPAGGTVSDTSGTTITNDTPTVTPLTPSPSIAIVKTGAVGGTGMAGDMVTYTFTVTNTGNTTLSNIVINDVLTASVNLAVIPSTLAPNGIGTASVTYTIQQSDVNTGTVTNSATVTGTTPAGGTVSDTSGTTITNDTPTVTTLTPSPSIAVVKTGAVGGTGTVGDMVTYTFTVTNTGNTTLSNIVINDLLTNSVNLAVTPSTLAPNAIGTATATYVIQQSDVNAGQVTNSATVTGTTPAGGTVSDTSGTTITNDTPTVTPLTPSPSIAVVKTGAVGGTGMAGDMVTYTFTVTNTGNTTLSNIVVNDALTNSVNLAVTPSTLAPNAIGTATATYVIQQSDVNVGQVTNSATVTGTTPAGGTVSDTSGTTITNDTPTVTTLTPSPSIAVVKTGAVGGTGMAGDMVTYTFTVTNTGNTTLSNIVINDLLTASVNLAVTPSTLAPNAIGTATATYTIQQSDVNVGQVTNSATVTGTTPAGGTVSDTSGTTITNDTPTVTTLTPSPSIAVVKTGAVGGTGMAGDMVTYTFTVTNTGNTTLSNIVINDLLTASVNLAVTPSTLAPNAIGTATATYTIQQSDVNVGQVTNSATVTGTTPAGGTVSDTSGTTITNDTPTVTPLTPSPSIAVVKTGAVGGTGMAGDMVTYTFTVTNTGNTTLSNIVINDLLTASVNLAVTPSTLAPNAIGTATATYTIQQSDVNVGQVTNTATVTGTTPAGGTVSDTSGTTITNDTPTVTTLTPSPSIAVVKTGAVGGTGMAGDMVTYTFTVTNTGNTTLSNIVINDALTNSVNLAVIPSTLAPNAIGTATATYTIQQSDVNVGQVTNSATVTGTTPAGGTVSDTSGTTITNDTPTVTPLTPSPSIAVVKTGAVGGTGMAGDMVTYTFTVTNTGNTTLSNIVINDLLTASVNLAVTPSTLAPNGIGTATATYVIQQSDVNAGQVTNSATVTGTTPAGGTVSDTSGTTITNDTPTVTTLTPSPSIAIVKTGAVGGTGMAGDMVTYTFTVTNTGNTTLSNIVINDALTNSVNLAVTPSTLVPNGIGTATATYTIQQSDVNVGQVTNTATVTGTTPAGGTVSDTSGTTITNDTPTVTTLTPSPSIAVVKTGAVGGTGMAGDMVTYTFTVTNTGNTTLSNIVINDALTNSVNLAVTPSTLAPNAIGTATATYTIQQSDVNAGQVTNSATVTGTTPAGGTVSDTSGTTITNDTPTVTILNPLFNIKIMKEGVYEDKNKDGIANVGDVINYTFTITNTGNTVLENITIRDDNVPTVRGTLNSLDVGASDGITFTAVYSITDADIALGYVYNSAIASAISPVKSTITAVSADPTPCITCPADPNCLTCTITAIPQAPSIAIVKKAVFDDNNGDGYAEIGETISYAFTVMNTGNLALTNVVVTDALPGIVISGGEISLAVGATDGTSFHGLYHITQQDIIKGSVSNQAMVKGTTPSGAEVVDLSDDDSPLQDEPTVLGIDGCSLEAFNAVSPDGDGLNDFFRIRGIECYPKNTVEVYNRWGVKVYDAEGYNNDTVIFSGISEGRATVNKSEGLPSGTYFYIIKYEDFSGNGINKSGYLNISRE